MSRLVQLLAVLLIASLSVGCGGGAHYTIEGSANVKKIVVKKGETVITEIPIQTAVGGNLSGDAVKPDGSFTLEQDGVTVRGTVSGGMVNVGDVEMDGEFLAQGTMLDI